MNACCGLHPVCYCRALPPDDPEYVARRRRTVRAATPPGENEEIDAETRHPSRKVRALGLALVVGLAALVVLLAALAG